MYTRLQIDEIMERFKQAICTLLGEDVKDVILFGSYARGDAEETSDIDVMVPLNLPRERLTVYRRQVAQIAGKILLEYGVLVSPILESKEFFERNRTMYPFFQSVDKEGIRYLP